MLEIGLEQSPRELVEKARRGDEAAFAALVRSFERTALAIAYAALGDASAAGDVTQEAFVRAWQRMRELNDPDRFGSWLARIVRNLAADHRRRTPRETTQPELHESQAVRLVASPSDEMDRSELRNGIDAALADLDDLTRSAIVLRYYEGLASKEIAELLELSPAAVDMRLSRGRAELKQKLAWTRTEDAMKAER